MHCVQPCCFRLILTMPMPTLCWPTSMFLLKSWTRLWLALGMALGWTPDITMPGELSPMGFTAPLLSACLCLQVSVPPPTYTHTHLSFFLSCISSQSLLSSPILSFYISHTFFLMPLCPESLFTLFSASKDDGCLISLTIYPLC